MAKARVSRPKAVPEYCEDRRVWVVGPIEFATFDRHLESAGDEAIMTRSPSTRNVFSGPDPIKLPRLNWYMYYCPTCERSDEVRQWITWAALA